MSYWIIGTCFVILSIAHLDLRLRLSCIEARMKKESAFLRMAHDPKDVVDQVVISARPRVFESLATSEDLKKRIVESINELQLEKG